MHSSVQAPWQCRVTKTASVSLFFLRHFMCDNITELFAWHQIYIFPVVNVITPDNLLAVCTHRRRSTAVNNSRHISQCENIFSNNKILGLCAKKTTFSHSVAFLLSFEVVCLRNVSVHMHFRRLHARIN